MHFPKHTLILAIVVKVAFLSELFITTATARSAVISQVVTLNGVKNATPLGRREEFEAQMTEGDIVEPLNDVYRTRLKGRLTWDKGVYQL